MVPRHKARKPPRSAPGRHGTIATGAAGASYVGSDENGHQPSAAQGSYAHLPTRHSLSLACHAGKLRGGELSRHSLGPKDLMKPNTRRRGRISLSRDSNGRTKWHRLWAMPLHAVPVFCGMNRIDGQMYGRMPDVSDHIVSHRGRRRRGHYLVRRTLTVTVMPNVNPIIWMALRLTTTSPHRKLATLKGSHRERLGWHRPLVVQAPTRSRQRLRKRPHRSRLPSMAHRS